MLSKVKQLKIIMEKNEVLNHIRIHNKRSNKIIHQCMITIIKEMIIKKVARNKKLS